MSDNPEIQSAIDAIENVEFADDRIGNPAVDGSLDISGDTYTVTGSGSDFWDNYDKGYWAYHLLYGDGQITARVISMTNTDYWAKAGVMYMGIKNCKECQQKVSTSAKTCPHCGKKYPTGGFTMPAKIFLIFIFLAILGQIISSTDEPDNNKTEHSASTKLEPKKSLEYQLAVINNGGYVSENHTTINRFRYLLEILNSKTTNSKQEIADMSVAGIRLLKDKYGIEMSLLTFMESVDASISNNPEIKFDYADVATAFVQLIKN